MPAPTPAWLSTLASAAGNNATRDEMLAMLDADIKSEVATNRRKQRAAAADGKAALERLQRDADEHVAERSAARKSHVSSSATSPQSYPQQLRSGDYGGAGASGASPASATAMVGTSDSPAYHELLYAEGMLGKAERAKWREEAQSILLAQELDGCTFEPHLNGHSEELVALARDGDARPLSERAMDVLEEQKERRLRLAQELEDERRRDAARPPKSSSAAAPRSPEAFLEDVARRAQESRESKQRLASDTLYARYRKAHAPFGGWSAVERTPPSSSKAAAAAASSHWPVGVGPAGFVASAEFMGATAAATARYEGRPRPGSSPRRSDQGQSTPRRTPPRAS